jgi:hypothetical protein
MKMKKIILPIVLALFATGMAFTSCESSAQKIENAEQDVTDAQAKLLKARQDSAADYEKLKLEWATRAANNDRAIADYKAKIASEDKIKREKDEAHLAELQKRNDAMKADVNGYKPGEKDDWAAFKKGFNKMTDEYDEDMQSFANSVGKVIDGK